MPNSSSTKATKTLATPKVARRKAARKATARNRAARATPRDLTAYLAPGAAVLGSGLLTAVGVVLRKQLGHLLETAIEGARSQGGTVVDQLDVGKLLSLVGLQRTSRGPLVGMGIGAAAGMLAGSALTLWLGPMIKEAMASQAPAVGAGTDSSTAEPGHHHNGASQPIA